LGALRRLHPALRRNDRGRVPLPRSRLTILLAQPEQVGDGVRLAVKDLFDTAGLETTYGSAIFAGHVPRETAPAVRLLEEAGYAVVGKANLHEFAYGTTSENPHFGDVENPRRPGHVAGGSSGGSAAAVAAGLADAALGTDSAGSIRIPAACCGVVGHKPTHGLVPLDGCWPLAASFDTGGPIAADVEGCERMLRALVPGYEPVELASLEEVEVAVAWTELAEPSVRERVEAAARVFPRRRHVELPLPAGETYAPFMREAADVHRELFAESASGYGEDVRIKVERCLAVTDADVERGARLRTEYAERVEEALDGVDLVVTPTLPIEPPRLHRGVAAGDLDVREQLIRFTYPFSALGWPALALGYLQIAGRAGTDALVLAAGRLVSPV
jgi:Asp-tRNA(Asn)/Glu-tRNA(Gln) amidotransferase A subunit family amidase